MVKARCVLLSKARALTNRTGALRRATEILQMTGTKEALDTLKLETARAEKQECK